MSNNMIQIALGILFVGLCFAVGALLGNRKAPKRKTTKARRADTLPLSAFSTFDHPAGKQAPHEINLVAEAEVFMIYGKRATAQEILNKGVSQGQVSPEEVEAFWARHQAEK
jgi:hypothetical protein